MSRSVPNEVGDDGYRWTCPHCGKSRVNASTGEAGRRNAETALRTHLVASAGAGHGPRHAFPAEVRRVELAAHVERVDPAETA